MPVTHAGVRVRVRVVPVHSLPGGRRFARLDGPGECALLIVEGTVMDTPATEELQELMQEAINSRIYGQHWGGPEEPPQPEYIG